MAITQGGKFRVITTTLDCDSEKDSFRTLDSSCLVINSSNGGIYLGKDGSTVNTLKQIAAIPGHTHSGYLSTAGGTVNGILTVSPSHVSGVQDVLILHDKGYGSGESLAIKWTSASYTDGVSLYGSPSGKVLLFDDGSTAHKVIHTGNIGEHKAWSATKLAAARTIWGQNFDGTDNVDGNIILSKGDRIVVKDGTATNSLIALTNSNSCVVGYAAINEGYSTLVYGNKIRFRYGQDAGDAMVISSDGNIGIGTDTPTSKLEVNGNVKATKFIGDVSGNLTGTADNANTVGGYAHTSLAKVFSINSSYTDVNSIPIPYDNQNSFQEWHLPGLSYNGIIQWKDYGGNWGQIMHTFGGDKALYYRGSGGDKQWRQFAFTEDIPSLEEYATQQWVQGQGYYPKAGGALTGNVVSFANGAELYNVSSTELNINKNSSTRWVTINDDGVSAKNFITTSDRRMKENIEELQDCSKSLELGFYKFDYKTGGHSAGHIAQDVRETYPAFVHGNETEDEYLSIDYNALHSVQIKALKDENDKLKSELNELKQLILDLKHSLNL